jgi:Lon protease-like protein
MDLPSIIPIFPLPNVVLFPGVPLPLHIFEPRYREMVQDAAASHEIVGMALLRGQWQQSYYQSPEIFETGCAGRLVSVESLPNGRFNIVLHGFREFTIGRHIFEKPYRQAEVRWRLSGQRSIGTERRARLISLLTGFLGTQPDSPGHRLMHDPTLTDDLLVNFFSYALGLAPLEKQGLLEAASLTDRAERLHDILEFHIEELRFGARPPGSGRGH